MKGDSMIIDDFIKKWDQKGIDFDGVYGDQCMDLMHQYCVEVLGLTDGKILRAPSAKDVWLTNIYGKEKFESIQNTPTGVPNRGDIVLWGTGIGPYGHVAIFNTGDINTFYSFDQNFPTGTKCHIQKHDYKGVLGWLRYLPTSPPGSIPAGGDTASLLAKIKELEADKDILWREKKELEDINHSLDISLTEERNKKNGLKTAIVKAREALSVNI